MNKEILELIEPYTDKTLSEGCLIKNKNNRFFKFNWKESKRQFAWCDDFYKTNWISDWNLDIYLSNQELEKYKILWHYDITAVIDFVWETIKELEEQEWDLQLEYSNITWIFTITSRFKWYEQYEWLYIINKPLHLYTEQEQSDLLKLLKQLWNTNT